MTDISGVHRRTADELATRSGGDSLRPFYSPGSVALVGASRTPGKWGYELATRLLRGAAQRRVHLVSRSGEPIAGRATHRSLTELPERIDLVVAAVPPDDLEKVVDEGLAIGSKGFVCVSGGMGELGGAEMERERSLVARVRARGARLLGPNCLGLLDTHSGLTATAWFDELAERPGSVAVITQSGTVGLDFDLLARRAGIGFSRFVSVGNQADVNVAELLEDLADHEPTKLVVVYCEAFSSGRRTFEAAQTLVELGKPVLMLAPGTSRAAARAAQSHTGSLTSSRDVVAAACDAAGVHLLQTTADVVDTAQLMLRTSRPAGRRVAVVADGGGSGVLISDVLDSYGLDVPLLSEDTQSSLRDRLGPSASTDNPIDLAAAAADSTALDGAVDIVVRSGEVDGIVVTGFIGDPVPSSGSREGVGPTTIITPSTARDAIQRGVPVVVQALFDDSPSVDALRDLPVAVYRTANSVGLALGTAAQTTRRHAGVPVLTTNRPLVMAGDDYFAARGILTEAGIPFMPAIPVADGAADVVRAASDLRFPLVLKAADRLHKSDDGGVVLGIADQGALLRAHDDLVTRLGTKLLAVEEMADAVDGVELIIGAKRDPQLGPVALVGFGGVYAEVIRDVQLRLAPVTVEEAMDAIKRLSGAEVLFGARGQSPIDVHAVAVCLSKLSRVAAEASDIEEIEVNPLLATPDRVVGLDARVVKRLRGPGELTPLEDEELS